MKENLSDSYNSNAEFWRKNSPRIFSDVEVRPAVVRLLGQRSSGRVLEAGSGTGYMARLLARANPGAEIFGCELHEEMLRRAQESEKAEPLNIRYASGDVTKLSSVYQPDFFDAITSVSVVLHLSTEEFEQFVSESFKILKPGGTFVLSSLHPFLFSSASPTRTEERCWVKHKPLEQAECDRSRRFEELLFDVDGNEFTSLVWYHPLPFFLNTILAAGLRIEAVREVCVRKADLITPIWGTAHDYPAYLQIRAVKPEIG